MQRKLQFIAKKFDNVLIRLCEAAICYMAISLLHFTSFFQGEDNSMETGENHYESGHVESFSYNDGELVVGLVHTSHREHNKRSNS